jgi:hypothetical protein
VQLGVKFEALIINILSYIKRPLGWRFLPLGWQKQPFGKSAKKAVYHPIG